MIRYSDMREGWLYYHFVLTYMLHLVGVSLNLLQVVDVSFTTNLSTFHSQFLHLKSSPATLTVLQALSAADVQDSHAGALSGHPPHPYSPGVCPEYS